MSNAIERNFVRDYHYEASEDDSKNMARTKALAQVKKVLLEEIGVYIRSYVKIEQSTNKEDFITQDIETVTAGITKVKVIEELWNGTTFYVSAEVTTNPEEVAEHLNEAIKTRANSKNIKKLEELLSTKDSEIKKLSLESMKKEKLLNSKASELSQLKKEIQKSNAIIKKYNADIIHERTELAHIKKEIKQAGDRVTRSVVIGMTEDEVISVVGKPRGGRLFLGSGALNYGRKWVVFDETIVACLSDRNISPIHCRKLGY